MRYILCASSAACLAHALVLTTSPAAFAERLGAVERYTIAACLANHPSPALLGLVASQPLWRRLEASWPYGTAQIPPGFPADVHRSNSFQRIPSRDALDSGAMPPFYQIDELLSEPADGSESMRSPNTGSSTDSLPDAHSLPRVPWETYVLAAHEWCAHAGAEWLSFPPVSDAYAYAHSDTYKRFEHVFDAHTSSGNVPGTQKRPPASGAQEGLGDDPPKNTLRAPKVCVAIAHEALPPHMWTFIPASFTLSADIVARTLRASADIANAAPECSRLQAQGQTVHECDFTTPEYREARACSTRENESRRHTSQSETESNLWHAFQPGHLRFDKYSTTGISENLLSLLSARASQNPALCVSQFCGVLGGWTTCALGDSGRYPFSTGPPSIIPLLKYTSIVALNELSHAQKGVQAHVSLQRSVPEARLDNPVDRIAWDSLAMLIQLGLRMYVQQSPPTVAYPPPRRNSMSFRRSPQPTQEGSAVNAEPNTPSITAQRQTGATEAQGEPITGIQIIVTEPYAQETRMQTRLSRRISLDTSQAALRPVLPTESPPPPGLPVPTNANPWHENWDVLVLEAQERLQGMNPEAPSAAGQQSTIFPDALEDSGRQRVELSAQNFTDENRNGSQILGNPLDSTENAESAFDRERQMRYTRGHRSPSSEDNEVSLLGAVQDLSEDDRLHQRLLEMAVAVTRAAEGIDYSQASMYDLHEMNSAISGVLERVNRAIAELHERSQNVTQILRDTLYEIQIYNAVLEVHILDREGQGTRAEFQSPRHSVAAGAHALWVNPEEGPAHPSEDASFDSLTEEGTLRLPIISRHEMQQGHVAGNQHPPQDLYPQETRDQAQSLIPAAVSVEERNVPEQGLAVGVYWQSAVAGDDSYSSAEPEDVNSSPMLGFEAEDTRAHNPSANDAAEGHTDSADAMSTDEHPPRGSPDIPRGVEVLQSADARSNHSQSVATEHSAPIPVARMERDDPSSELHGPIVALGRVVHRATAPMLSRNAASSESGLPAPEEGSDPSRVFPPRRHRARRPLPHYEAPLVMSYSSSPSSKSPTGKRDSLLSGSWSSEGDVARDDGGPSPSESFCRTAYGTGTRELYTCVALLRATRHLLEAVYLRTRDLPAAEKALWTLQAGAAAVSCATSAMPSGGPAVAAVVESALRAAKSHAQEAPVFALQMLASALSRAHAHSELQLPEDPELHVVLAAMDAALPTVLGFWPQSVRAWAKWASMHAHESARVLSVSDMPHMHVGAMPLYTAEDLVAGMHAHHPAAGLARPLAVAVWTDRAWLPVVCTTPAEFAVVAVHALVAKLSAPSPGCFLAGDTPASVFLSVTHSDGTPKRAFEMNANARVVHGSWTFLALRTLAHAASLALATTGTTHIGLGAAAWRELARKARQAQRLRMGAVRRQWPAHFSTLGTHMLADFLSIEGIFVRIDVAFVT